MKPLFSDLNDFCWATGIENTFIPQARMGMHPLDEYELTQHYQNYELDYSLAASLGVRALRWGIPWYRVEPEPGRFDWDWTDRALEVLMERLGLVPIVDLMHYGTPLWLDNSFINAYYPQRVGDYAAAVARRYGDRVKVYTPLNEPMVNTEMCGMRGEWPPYLVGNDGYIQMVMALARGMAFTSRAVCDEVPGAVLLQVEALWLHETRSQNQAHQAQVEHGNARQYLGFDLATGQVGSDYPLLNYLLENGAREIDLAWLCDHPAHFDVLGVNFYPWSYSEMAPDHGGVLQRTPARARGSVIAQVLRNAWQRYRLPVMVTETSASGSVDDRQLWMDETLAAVWDLRRQGVPVVGYTWFPMMTMVDWDYRQGEGPVESFFIHLGLFDSHFDNHGRLVRVPTRLVESYQRAVESAVPPLEAI